MKKLIFSLVLTLFVCCLNSINVKSETTIITYFCCYGLDGGCFTTNGTVWVAGIYTPCGTTPCTADKCTPKTEIDSDGRIEHNVYFVINQNNLSGEGYTSIDLYYDSGVHTGDVQHYDVTQTFTTYLSWLQAVQP